MIENNKRTQKTECKDCIKILKDQARCEKCEKRLYLAILIVK